MQDIDSAFRRGGWIATVLLVSLLVSPHATGETELDKVELNQVEERSESLANSLLEFSVTVRERDMTRIGKFFESPGPGDGVALSLRRHGYGVQVDLDGRAPNCTEASEER